MLKNSKDSLENFRTTTDGIKVLVKKPYEYNRHTQNICLTYAEYEFLVTNVIDRFEILYPQTKSIKVKWNPSLLQFAQFRGKYYLIPFSVKSLLVPKSFKLAG